jgi:hypothetical protein
LVYRPKSIIYTVFGFYYVFLLLCLCILIVCMLCSVYSVFIVPTGILWLPWLKFFRAFFSVVRQMPGYTSQRWDTVHTLPNEWLVLFYVLFMSIVLLYVLSVCQCVLYYCHWVATQLQLNISYQNKCNWKYSTQQLETFWQDR